jgi:hypothetical protein
MVYFKSWAGLKKLSGKAKGTETLGVGIRPYGLHAGNLASVVAYPYLFLERFEASHLSSPRFRFQVWLNDIEPATNVGADGRPESADWANMYPGSKTFQFTQAPNGFKCNLADYWQPAIEGVVRGIIGARFPDVVLEFHRASELIVTPEFQKTIIGCIKKADQVKDVINAWNRGVATVQGPTSFVWPVCPKSHDPLINPKLEQANSTNLITVPSEFLWRSTVRQMPVNELSWAVQFRMLQVARLAAIKPDIWFMGMDHVPTSMGNLLNDLADLFGLDRYKGTFLHAPLLFADGNKKLSKSLGNAVYMPIEDLIDALRGNINMGVDVKYAPVSSDILNIGPDLLPSHIIGPDKERRLAAVKHRQSEYISSGQLRAFRSANKKGKIRNYTVAGMLGVPHV